MSPDDLVLVRRGDVDEAIGDHHHVLAEFGVGPVSETDRAYEARLEAALEGPAADHPQQRTTMTDPAPSPVASSEPARRQPGQGPAMLPTLALDPRLSPDEQRRQIRGLVQLFANTPRQDQVIYVADDVDVVAYLERLDLPEPWVLHEQRVWIHQGHPGRVFVRVPERNGLGVRGLHPIAIYLDGRRLNERGLCEFPEILRRDVPGASVVLANQPTGPQFKVNAGPTEEEADEFVKVARRRGWDVSDPVFVPQRGLATGPFYEVGVWSSSGEGLQQIGVTGIKRMGAG